MLNDHTITFWVRLWACRALRYPLWVRGLLCCLTFSWSTSWGMDIEILYLKQTIEQGPVLSNVLADPQDSGLKGALLGIEDNNQAGRFLNQHYRLVPYESSTLSQLLQKARDWIKSGQHLMVTDLPSDSLLQLIKDPAIRGQAIMINASARDNALRDQKCQSGLLHTMPSDAMLSDALMQFLVSKRWKDFLLISGSRPEDQQFAQSLKRSAKRFGAKAVAEKSWTFDSDLRRSAAQEVPLFTQGKDYDVVVTADISGDFGEFIPYNTWLPRPVSGTQGLTPVAWHRVVEQWGAAQLQNRFQKLSGRWMNGRDYSSWLAIRSFAEAITRTNSLDHRELYAYLLGPDFQLAGFKGRKLSFRHWNGQMRQPIPLVHPRALVTTAPMPGYLHPRTELDTLGYDQAEVKCIFSNSLGSIR